MSFIGYTKPGADAKFAPQGLPSYAPAGLLNRYDPLRNVYNWKPSNTRRLRAGLGKAASGLGLSRHAMIGDSTTIGYMGTGFDKLKAWPYIFRDRLASLMGTTAAGTGFVRFSDVGSPAGWLDPRWATTGSWILGYTYQYAQAVGATATFTSDIAGTIVDVGYFNAGGAFTVSIDGGGAVTVTPTGTALPTLYTVTGLANTTHTVVITTLSTSVTSLMGAGVRASTGFVVDNVSQSGSTASGTGVGAWADLSTITNPLPMMKAVIGTPDCVWVALGENDMNTGVSIATTIAALTTIIGQFPNSDIVLVAEYHSNAGLLSTWQSYVGALYTLADTLNVPLLDLFDRSGGYAVANANGLQGDANHPNQAGHRDTGRCAAVVAAA